MKIVITGDGDTGVHLARQLSQEEQEVVLIGSDAKRLADLDTRYNFLTVVGNATSPNTLRQAGTRHCDLFVAVTPWGNENLVSAEFAKAMQAGRTVARVDCAEFLEDANKAFFANRGVDMLVYPEYLASTEIITAINHPALRRRYSLHDGEIVVASIRVEPGAPLDGITLRDFAKEKYHFHVAAIRRNSEVIIPTGRDTLHGGDILFVSYTSDVEPVLVELCGRRSLKIESVMITGAGKMAANLVRRIGNRLNVTVIDPDAKRCNTIADINSDVTVVRADYRDLEVLREEGLHDVDAFIALTDTAETNIVSCMVARDAGVSKTIAEIEDLQYFQEADSLNIDTVINKKLITSSTIYQMLLDSLLHSPRCLALEDAEVAEIIVGAKSKVASAPIRDLKLSKGMTIAAMIRDGKGMLVDGDTRIVPGDHVVVFCLSGMLPGIDRYFK